MASLTITATVISGILAVLPVFLIGGVAIFMREDLAFTQRGVGLAIAAFFGTFALLSAPGGRLVERLGPRRGMLLGALFSSMALLGTATIARSLRDVVLLQILAGIGNSLAQPAGNLALARAIRHNRQGFAFGLKQAAIPSATLFAGATVPLLVVWTHWRWSFAVASLVVIALVLVLQMIGPMGFHVSERGNLIMEPSSGPAIQDTFSSERVEYQASIRMLVVLAIAYYLASASAMSLGSFLVESATESGMSPSAAGFLLAGGSVVGVLTRLAAGWITDRTGGRSLRTVARMLIVGSSGFAMLAVGQATLILPGTLLAFGAGWGWNGLFNLAIIRVSRNSPAAATGVVMTGVGLGGASGPFAFGLVVMQWGFAAAWYMSAALGLLAGILVISARRHMLVHQQVGS